MHEYTLRNMFVYAPSVSSDFAGKALNIRTLTVSVRKTEQAHSLFTAGPGDRLFLKSLRYETSAVHIVEMM